MIPISRTFLRAGLCALPLLAAVAAPAKAAGITDAYWQTDDDKFVFHLTQCGEELCGDLVWLLRVLDRRTDDVKRDKDNTDPSLRDRPVCGMRLVTELEPDGENEWGSGRFYNPDDGNSYSVSMDYEPDADALEMRVYLGVPMLGKTMRLRRVEAPAESCEERGAAAMADLEDYYAKTPGTRWEE